MIAILGLTMGIAYQEFGMRVLVFPLEVILSIIGFTLQFHSTHDPSGFYYRWAYILLSLIEPFFHERALLVFEIDTKECDLKEIVEWVKKLQSSCRHIFLRDKESVIKLDKR